MIGHTQQQLVAMVALALAPPTGFGPRVVIRVRDRVTCRVGDRVGW